MKILFAGIIARYPFGGVTWCSLMYLLGLRALGHEVFYIEDTGECVYDPIQNTRATDPSYGTGYIHAALEPHGLGDRWAFVNYDGSYHGRSADDVRRYCADADLYLNLSGGSWFWRDEYARIPSSAFIDSDPAFTQLAIAKAEPWYVDFFKRYDRLFTFGANVGTPASPIPVGDFTWHKTWQPIVLDEWASVTPPGPRFTSVMTWQIESFTDVGGNKDQEFVKYIELPSRTPPAVRARHQRPAAAAAGSRLVHRGGHERLADAGRVPGFHPPFPRGVRRRQAHLRRQPVGMVQRSDRVLPGGGTPRARAGHRLDRAPAGRRGAAGLLVARRGARRHRSHQRRLRAARPRGVAGSRASTSTPTASCRGCSRW